MWKVFTQLDHNLIYSNLLFKNRPQAVSSHILFRKAFPFNAILTNKISLRNKVEKFQIIESATSVSNIIAVMETRLDYSFFHDSKVAIAGLRCGSIR